MDRKIAHLALFAALGIPFAAIAVPFAEETSIQAAADARPGELQWHRSAYGAPFLSVGGFGGGREAIRDPDALHRAALSVVEPPDYAIDVGEGVSVSNGCFVLWAGEETQGDPLTRWITITPAAGREIVAVETVDLRRDAASVEVSAAGARIYRAQNGNVPGFAATTDCAFSIARVLARDSMSTERSDDLTMGDYLYTDALGATSLGGLRPWVLSRLDGHRGDDWALHPASAPVRLAGMDVALDPYGRFVSRVSSTSNDCDTATLWAGGRAAITVRAEESETNTAFRITSYRQEAGTNILTVAAIGTNVAVVAASSLSTPAASWAEVPGVAVDYAPVSVGGVPSYTLRWPVSGPTQFYRARTDVSETHASVEFGVPLILRSPNGARWRISVDDSGNLSAEAAQ